MKFKFILLLLFGVNLILPALCFGIPQLISYQGHINDSYGVPINGDLTFTFSIYDDPYAGNRLWTTEPGSLVTVTKGTFNVKLGPIPSTVFSTDNLYLGVKIGTDREMTPRQRITSGSFSYVAEKALSVATNTITANNLNVSGTTAGQVLSSSGTQARWLTPMYVPIGSIIAWVKNMDNMPALPDGWVECNGLQINDAESPLLNQKTPNLNGPSNGNNRFLRGNTSSYPDPSINSNSYGGSESFNWSHTHSYVSSGPFNGYNRFAMSYSSGYYSDSQGNPQDLRPPYFDVVWIMRIK